MIDIKKFMTKKIYYIDKEDSILKAARMMKINSVSCLLVREKGKYIGIITERDITEKCVAEEMDPNTKVEEIMSFPIYSVDSDQDVMSVAFIAKQKKIKKIPVMKNKEIIGIITDTDLIKAFLEWMQLIQGESEKKKSEIPFTNKAMSVIKKFNKEYEATKVWHMLCENCNHKFFVEEKEGKLVNQNCPKCGSKNAHYIT
jgi:signal-transduction protein with cAMP-binding, CBS, and nucleotidyltransferase domain